MKFEIEIPKQTWVTQKNKKKTKKKNNLSYAPETKLPRESGNQATYSVWKPKNPIWPPGGHFESDMLKINRLLPIATNNMHMKFEI